MAAAKKKKEPKIPVAAAAPIRLDLGCGPNKQPGYIGVDAIAFPGVDLRMNIGTEKWPWEDGSVEHIHSSHFVEHLDGPQRIHLVNEAYRVLKPGGQMFIVTPDWSSCRAYGDLTHKWPPVSEFWFFYLDRDWRAANAPHNDFYTCDFHVGYGFGVHERFQTMNDEGKMFAMAFYKNATPDIMATLTKK